MNLDPDNGHALMSETSEIITGPVTTKAFASYGWLLGKPFPQAPGAIAYASATSAFWHEHAFDPGAGGEFEVLWVTYQDNTPSVGKLEKHHLTQQAVIPLVGDVVQIVATSAEDGTPDLATLRAFHLVPGVGVCMRPGVWHTTRSAGATCVMLTRRSTTIDLVEHLNGDGAALETGWHVFSPVSIRLP